MKMCNTCSHWDKVKYYCNKNRVAVGKFYFCDKWGPYVQKNEKK